MALGFGHLTKQRELLSAPCFGETKLKFLNLVRKVTQKLVL